MKRCVYGNKVHSENVRKWLQKNRHIVAVHDTGEKEVLFEKTRDREAFLDYVFPKHTHVRPTDGKKFTHTHSLERTKASQGS